MSRHDLDKGLIETLGNCCEEIELALLFTFAKTCLMSWPEHSPDASLHNQSKTFLNLHTRFFWLLCGVQDKYHTVHYLWQFWRGPCLSHCTKLISVRSSRFQGCDVNCRFVNTQLLYKLVCVEAVIKFCLLDLLCCVLAAASDGVVPAVTYQPLNSGKFSSLWCWIEAEKVPDLPKLELNWRRFTGNFIAVQHRTKGVVMIGVYLIVNCKCWSTLLNLLNPSDKEVQFSLLLKRVLIMEKIL